MRHLNFFGRCFFSSAIGLRKAKKKIRHIFMHIESVWDCKWYSLLLFFGLPISMLAGWLAGWPPDHFFCILFHNVVIVFIFIHNIHHRACSTTSVRGCLVCCWNRHLDIFIYFIHPTHSIPYMHTFGCTHEYITLFYALQLLCKFISLSFHRSNNH